MYQAENTNFKTNESFTQEFTRSCLGRIIIAGVIILVGLLVAYFTAPKESDMNAEMVDNLMQCLEVNDGIKGDAVDDYVQMTMFTTSPLSSPLQIQPLFQKTNWIHIINTTVWSRIAIRSTQHPSSTTTCTQRVHVLVSASLVSSSQPCSTRISCWM